MANIARLSNELEIVIPKQICANQHWKVGQEFAFIPQGEGVLVIPVPTLEDLDGIAKGAHPTNYRDRNDRY